MFEQDMEERNTSGGPLSQAPATPSLRAEVNQMSEDNREEFLHCPAKSQTLHCLIICIAVVGIVGNLAVLWLLGFRVRRSAVSVYILNLAAADATILCGIPIHIILETINPHFFDHLLSLFFSNAVVICSYIAGLSMLSAISVERCLSVLWPIWYRCHRPPHTSAVACALLWTAALLLSLLQQYFCSIGSAENDGWCMTLDVFIATYLTVLFVLLSGSSLALVLRMFCGSRRIRMTRLRVTVLLTVLVFLFCGLPAGFHYFLLYRFQNVISVFPCFYHRLLSFLSCVNSSANCFIYFFVGSFRQRKGQSLKRVLQRALQDTAETDEAGGVGQQSGARLTASAGA